MKNKKLHRFDDSLSHCAILIKGKGKKKEWNVITAEDYDDNYTDLPNIELGHQGSKEDCEDFININKSKNT